MIQVHKGYTHLTHITLYAMQAAAEEAGGVPSRKEASNIAIRQVVNAVGPKRILEHAGGAQSLRRSCTG